MTQARGTLDLPRKLAGARPEHIYKRRHSQGHPARLTREEKRQRRRDKGNQREQQIQTLSFALRRAIDTSPEEDGLGVGPLDVAAHFFAPQLADAWGLEEGEDRAKHVIAIAYYLRGIWGDTVRELELDPTAYNDWRERGRALAESACGPD